MPPPHYAPPLRADSEWGGAWGWFEVDASGKAGTADGTLTECLHGNPTFHVNFSNTPWALESGSSLSLSIFAVGTDPKGWYLVLPVPGLAFPVTPGHYTFTVAPRVFGQSQVGEV